MGKRRLLKVQDRQRLFDIPTDEDALIRHYSLSSADRLQIGLRRREHNRLGFAVQLCLMRYPGRVLATDETPPRAMLKYVAEQIGADAGKFALYARREETRRDHIARLMVYLAARSATGQDRRAALLAAIQAATMSDDGGAIAINLRIGRRDGPPKKAGMKVCFRAASQGLELAPRGRLTEAKALGSERGGIEVSLRSPAASAEARV